MEWPFPQCNNSLFIDCNYCRHSTHYYVQGTFPGSGKGDTIYLEHNWEVEFNLGLNNLLDICVVWMIIDP